MGSCKFDNLIINQIKSIFSIFVQISKCSNCSLGLFFQCFEVWMQKTKMFDLKFGFYVKCHPFHFFSGFPEMSWKTPEKVIKNLIGYLIKNSIDFWMIFQWFGAPSWEAFGTILGSKVQFPIIHPGSWKLCFF